ncbi:MlaD family protein [Mycolicibacterium brumae]|uniref:MCE family protein n=1 Tax=Mycolicibacterium brumae TaxID=85968 RepID=A0A2G5PDH7_9MYCO|nr:MlaD family protein [Mycolicibacterium brumae]MCV7193108.1 MCE family protein [Mycolicibacterium brumae]PIB75964.1 MCE family protein [Mycolicibacterium brumae]RWA16545.1 mammalian cell entry protein [Mycolicibacterium brumae DSM 44177]UWW09764.1 MlaD family protein [Mycolicibacterium brumae]
MQPVGRALREPLWWGVATIALASIIAVVVAWVYIAPPNRQQVTFFTDDAASIAAGDTVRVAGINVGTVKKVSLEPEQVRVDLTVDDDVFIGDQTQVEVRMLTVVGGYFVTLLPLGDRELGRQPIPVQRVTMPYSLIRTLSDATKITDNVSTRPVKESLDQLQSGLAGENSQILAKIIDAGDSVSQVLERQRGQLTSILSMSNEYISTMLDNRELIEYLITRIAILEQTLVLYGDGFAGSLVGLGKVVDKIFPLIPFYFEHRQDFINRVRGVLGEFQSLADRNGVTVRWLRGIRGAMQRTLDAQNAGTPPQLLATDLCFPVEGRIC